MSRIEDVKDYISNNAPEDAGIALGMWLMEIIEIHLPEEIDRNTFVDELVSSLEGELV